MYLDISLPVTDDHWQAAREFAEASIESRRQKIASRGQRRLQKILDDITYGTAAEFAVAAYLNARDVECTAPDLAVYAARQKSWAADLTCMHGPIHVKSCADARYDSWVFQYAPQLPGHERRYDCDPIIMEPHDGEYLALTRIDPTTHTITLAYMIHQPDTLGLYELPQVHQLRNSKRVLYPKTLDTNLMERYRGAPPPEWLGELATFE